MNNNVTDFVQTLDSERAARLIIEWVNKSVGRRVPGKVGYIIGMVETENAAIADALFLLAIITGIREALYAKKHERAEEK